MPTGTPLSTPARSTCESHGMDAPTSTPVAVTGFAHIRLTVADLGRSRAFYDALFGWQVAYEVPVDADEATQEALGFLYGGIIYSFPGGLFGLRPVALTSDAFSEDRVGLDHLSLSVATLEDLRHAATVLDELDVAHEPVKDIGGVSILEFRDPDGIALELSSPTG